MFQAKWDFVEEQGIGKLLSFLQNQDPFDEDVEMTPIEQENVPPNKVFSNKEYAEYHK